MSHHPNRENFLSQILAEMPFTGWSEATIAAAAQNLAAERVTFDRLFPGELADVMGYWSHQLDQAMTAQLQQQIAEAASQNPPRPLGVSGKIRLAVKIRLELMQDHRQAARIGLAKLGFAPPKLLPGGLAAKLAWDSIDAIWHSIGDSSSDFNWYSKRATLFAVYVATALVWLDDATEGQQETWQFLERRLGDVAAFHHRRQKLQTTLTRGLAQIFSHRVTCPILRPGILPPLP
ncbi:MAG: COQ9 family protein [Candidatus Symbiobacter sp.]|nr:COQ9 family protein [Candidatus Symbiobacter sp.]